MPPGQPHLLAGRIECHRQAGQYAVTWTQRPLAHEQLCLGVHERGGRAVADRHALRLPGRPRSEDDPGVVIRVRPTPFTLRDHSRAGGQRQPGAENRADAGLGPDQLGAIARVVQIDGDVGGAGGEDAEDRHIQIGCAGRLPDADTVARADAGPMQPGRHRAHRGPQRPVIQGGPPVIQGRGVRLASHGALENIDQRTFRCRKGWPGKPPVGMLNAGGRPSGGERPGPRPPTPKSRRYARGRGWPRRSLHSLAGHLASLIVSEGDGARRPGSQPEGAVIPPPVRS